MKTVLRSEDDSRFNGISNEIARKLDSISSPYSVAVAVGDKYRPRTQPLKWAIEAIVKSLEILKDEKWKEVTLYYSAGGKLLNPHGDFRGSVGSSGTIRAKHQVVVDSADFIARFRHVGKERPNTFAWMARDLKSLPQADQSHERLKGVLDKKRKQLPKDSRGIILIDRSELFMLTDFSIEAALYGNLVVRIGAPETLGIPLGEATAFRDHRGIFGLTSRISAVVIHERRVVDSNVINDWKVYPTDRANADTIRLTLEELQRFGNLEDRTNLCADNAQNGTTVDSRIT